MVTAVPVQRGDDFGLALSLLLRSYLAAATEALAGLPGGPRGYHVLTRVAYDQPPTQLALAQQLGIDRSVLTYVLDDLEEAGLIERQPDPTDRRAKRLIVTKAGQATLKRLQEDLCAAENHALRGLADDEKQTLRALLGRASLGQGNGASACAVAESVANSSC
jgi:DNA-binding MarR family transcriptional regulator